LSKCVIWSMRRNSSALPGYSAPRKYLSIESNHQLYLTSS
jgi:hypothetical protein